MLPFIRELTDIPEKIFDDIPEINLDNLVAMLSEYKKPLIASSFFDKKDRAVGIFYDKGIPVFSSPEGAAEAMAALYRYAFIKKRNYRVPDIQKAPEEAERIIKEADEGVIDEYRAKKVLGAYGIPTTAEAVARTLDEALNLAGEIGYPVALKVCSSDILHKTESGMVHLNINDGETLKNAFEFIKSKEAKSDVLVSEMVKGEREFMAGVSYFPGFPPCVMFGIGGIFAEAFKDRAIRLAPLGPCDVSSMTESLSCRDMLGSYRGMSSVDMDVLSHTLVALGQLALHFPEIREIDLNPIIITKDGKLKVADALFIKDSKAAEEC
jgi:acetyltransferase